MCNATYDHWRMWQLGALTASEIITHRYCPKHYHLVTNQSMTLMIGFTQDNWSSHRKRGGEIREETTQNLHSEKQRKSWVDLACSIPCNGMQNRESHRYVSTWWISARAITELRLNSPSICWTSTVCEELLWKISWKYLVRVALSVSQRGILTYLRPGRIFREQTML